jgi:hypothetical protein
MENTITITCTLCKKSITGYQPIFNDFKIDETNIVHICQDCIDKFMKWQGSNFAKLFPTSSMKKRFENKKLY